MAQIIGLPKLSPTMEEGVLVRWVKKEGDPVEPGDLIAEVETDKANMDFNLEDEGVLLKLLVNEGDTIALGAPVAILGEQGEDVSALVEEARAQVTGGSAPPEPAPAPSPSSEPQSGAASAPGRPTGGAREVSGESRPPDRPPAPTPPAPTPTPRPAGGQPRRILASPLAKSLAIDLGVDLRAIQGSGPGGRIVERDVRAVAEGGGQPPAADSAPAAGTATEASATPPSSTALAVVPPPSAPAPIPPSDAYVDQPISSMRKRIASRLTEAKRDVPHFYLRRSFDVSPLQTFRERLNRLLGDRGRVSLNDMIIKGVALALRRVPSCNAAFLGDAIRYHARVHIGVAVAIDEGLVTPVVRDADLKGIGVIANEVRDLARRARERRLKMYEIEGSTFTVSNLGMFGVEEFAAIINPPEAGLLAIGTVREEPVAHDGVIEIGKRMNLTMSCDHRVIDGALGAQFLRELVDLLERPESLAL